MKIVPGVRHLSTPIGPSVVTIGNFDGVHLGHQQLINRVLERSRIVGATPVVMTFEPHPMKVLAPERQLRRLFDFEDQHQRLAEMGVEVLIVEPFSREFSQLDPERFLLDYVYRPLAPETLVVGYDFSFGANRRGTIDFLRSKGQELGFQVESIAPFKVGDIPVSSSRIRQALAEHDVALAATLLGRSFYLTGVVERGKGRGQTIGVPTANLRVTAEILPAEGVYYGWALVKGQKYPAMINVGRNPTFEAGGFPISVEAHLPGFSGDLYGEELRLEFAGFLREERKFNSASELVTQIQADIREGKVRLGLSSVGGDRK